MKNLNKIILGLGLVSVLAGCGNSKEESVKAPEGAKISSDTSIETSKPDTSGEKATSLGVFEVKDQNGKKFSNEDFKDYDATVVNLWFTGCSACIMEMPELNKISDDLKKENVNFVSMCTDAEYDESTKKAYEDIMDKYKPSYQALQIPMDSPIREYVDKIFSYPTTIVVDKNGNIIGDEILGTINTEEQMAKVRANIEKAKEANK